MEDLRDVKAAANANLPIPPEGKIGYRPARQSRSVASEKKLVEAAEMLFARHGYTHAKISDIIRESGVSTGTFYHRFSDKEGLLIIMKQRFVAETEEAIAQWGQQAERHATLHAVMTSLAEMVFDTITRRIGVYRAMQEMAQVTPGYWQNFGSLSEDLARHTRRAVEFHRSEVTARDIDTATTNAVQVILLLIIQTRLGAGIMFPKTRDEFVLIVVQAGLGVLQPKEA